MSGCFDFKKSPCNYIVYTHAHACECVCVLRRKVGAKNVLKKVAKIFGG